MKIKMWENELGNIKQMLKDFKSLKDIGKVYGVSKQRIYQILTQYGIQTPIRKRKNFLRNKPPEYYWLWRLLSERVTDGRISNKIIANQLFEELIPPPEYCKVFGVKLDYGSKQMYFRNDNSPSLDRIVPEKGYVLGNVVIISWRANRIKNNGTAEEHEKIAEYIKRNLL